VEAVAKPNSLARHFAIAVSSQLLRHNDLGRSAAPSPFAVLSYLQSSETTDQRRRALRSRAASRRRASRFISAAAGTAASMVISPFTACGVPIPRAFGTGHSGPLAGKTDACGGWYPSASASVLSKPRRRDAPGLSVRQPLSRSPPEPIPQGLTVTSTVAAVFTLIPAQSKGAITAERATLSEVSSSSANDSRGGTSTSAACANRLCALTLAC
jgi:hypothetical protein